MLGAALLLCAVVAATRVLRDVAVAGTFWWGLGQVGGALCAALLAGVMSHAASDNGAITLASMIGAAWLGAELMDRLARLALRWLPTNGGTKPNGGAHD